MCGIAGIVDFSGLANAGNASAAVTRMLDAMRYRGPDGDGLFADTHAVLGHRRLAVIDLEGGKQPMGAAGGRVQIVFNGEIYNHLDLRLQLQGLGHTFCTNSDTEVILLGYLAWGEKVLERLNGMFAIAIWDSRERRLLLARDRVGEKPLYWTRQGSRIAFASETSALRAAGLAAGPVDAQALDCYLTLGYAPSPRTMQQGVNKLRPAHTLTVVETQQIERRYWSLPAEAPRAVSMEEAADEFESLLDDAVRRQLMSDVPLGAFLSGGLDSSLVVASMAKSTSRVVTNSIGSNDARFDESDRARDVARALGTEHHELIVTPSALEVIEKVALHCDEPLADSSVIPTWYVCEMARRTVTVALSGDGGDESFGGYTSRYVPHVAESRVREILPTAFRVPAFGTLGAIWPESPRLPRPFRLRTIFRNLARSNASAYCEDLAWLKSDQREALYTNEFIEELSGFTPRESVEPHYVAGVGLDPLSRAQRADLNVYMTDDVLMKVDRMSMAHSLEVRAPLLDFRILEFAARLPSALKLRGPAGKLLLRHVARKRLPASIYAAPKKGFAIPTAEWLRGDLAEFAHSRIFASNSITTGRLCSSTLQSMWSAHAQGIRDHSVVLWGLMMLSLWDENRSRHV